MSQTSRGSKGGKSKALVRVDEGSFIPTPFAFLTDLSLRPFNRAAMHIAPERIDAGHDDQQARTPENAQDTNPIGLHRTKRS